jgi:hypothetical protein
MVVLKLLRSDSDMAVVKIQLEMEQSAFGSRRRSRQGVWGRFWFRRGNRSSGGPRSLTTGSTFPNDRTDFSHVRILGPCPDVRSHSVSASGAGTAGQ